MTRVKVKIGSNIDNDKNVPSFSSIFDWMKFKLGVKVAYGLPLSLICLWGRSVLTFIVNAMVENFVPQGQILKSMKPYCVAPHMKALDEYIPDQL
jgi:hypothetical protein